MPSASAKTENADKGMRLDSWKEIAVYLGKAERTVKRWEKERGLPAHRLPGSGNASVYAYTAELDYWLKSGTALESEPSREDPPEVPQENRSASRTLHVDTAPTVTDPKSDVLLPHLEHRRKLVAGTVWTFGRRHHRSRCQLADGSGKQRASRSDVATRLGQNLPPVGPTHHSRLGL